MTERWFYIVALPTLDFYDDDVMQRVFPPEKIGDEMATKKIALQSRVKILKRGHTFEGATGTVVHIDRKPNGMVGYVTIQLDWEQDWKGGNGETMILGSRFLSLIT